MTRRIVFLLVAPVALVFTACSSGGHGAGIPSLPGARGPGTGSGASVAAASRSSSASRPRVGYSTTRVGQLHAAAQCIREHGVPDYQDPTLTADGLVFTDARSIQAAGANDSTAQQNALLNSIRQACGSLFVAAGLQPDDESPAPPQLVRAGVRAAECLRANGMVALQDPTSQTPFTPGHGFSLSADEMPNHGALGKQDPTLQRAFTACRPVLDAEIRASSLSSLAHD